VTNLPPDVECKVRCVVAGSDEARMASARGVVINLTQPLDQPPPSEAVSAARDGNYIGGRPNGPPSIATSGIDEPAGIAPEEESVERPEELKFDPEQPFVTTSTSQPPSLRNSNGRIAPAILIERNQLNNRRTLIFALLASIASISGIIGFLAFNRNLNQSADIASKVGAETIRTEPIERHEKVDVPSINNEKQKNNEMPTVDLPSSPPVLSKEGIGKTSEIQSSDSKPNAPETIIDRKNIAIDVSSFCLPIDSDKKGMIPLIAGIPGSVLQASVKFTGKSNEEQNLFNQLSQEKNGWNWRWERSNDNGKAWTALPDNASSILDANSTSLKIREDDKPNTIYRAILRIKNNGAFTAKDDFIDIHSIPSEATADYVTVQVMANEILSEPKTADVAIYIPAFLKNQYLVSFLATKGSKSLVSANKDRINYLDVRGLFHDTNESVFDKWDKSADVFLRLKRNRNELSDRFLRSKKILRETCKDCNPLVFEHRMSMDVFSKGLNALRDGNQKIASDIDYFSNWNSGEVLAWAEANRNPQIIEDFSKIPPNAIDGARIDNEVNKILKKYWVGRNGKVDGNNEEENWFQFVDKVIEDRKNFLILRNLILDKEFLYLSPESSFGIFSKPSGKSDDFDSASNSLAKKLRPVATVRLWMKIQIRSPSNSHQSPSGGMGGSAGPTDTKVEIKDLPPP
jgi:hypothetical protein